MASISAKLQQALAAREHSGLRRSLRQSELSQRSSDFSLNDYLGLSQHPMVRAAFRQAANEYGVGGCASPLLSGWQAPQAYLSKQLAEWLERDRALLFSSGFACNQGVLRALGGHYSVIHADRLIHASCYGSHKLKRFPHQAFDSLTERVAASDQAQLVLLESRYSMDGDELDWRQLGALKRKASQLDVWVDDAHGIGVSGDDGRSICGQLSQAEVDFCTVTFGKALGSNGAALLCEEVVADYLVNYCRDFIYSTAISPAQAAAVSAAIELVRSAEGRVLRQRLQDNIGYYQQLCQQHGIATPAAATSPIQWVPVGCPQITVKITERLAQQNMRVQAIRPPTVPEHTSRLRITISAIHDAEAIRDLVEALRAVID
ncbi:aminotransferase class I/II-fold pyridoxal phosphate-dependent enzyme [Pseudidiomarina taiwanensis]|uniref:8-amino-7-oxononanoate synthase n=1 Tax=Pseudidiomarina taiwanensis TaxID=337250 RepID=A0A432ZND7_9GAMM|nr:aminotransferase class I/II-fold pyridoxal phosphate-dependent enzyme [Pseudidiomarina taiwanensis]RUO79397.1 8-amino-7-oxononanoate synthase [Pseudidiomarina taiwanensis]